MAHMTIVVAQAEVAEASSGRTETPGHAAAESDFPPFDAQYWAPQIIWLVLIFGALYLVMSRIALPRVGGIIERRRATISGDIDRATAMTAQAGTAAQAYEKTLADARARAQATAQATHQRLVAEGDVHRKSLERELADQLTAAEAQIAATKSNAMTNVGEIAQEAAGAIVQHLTGKSADPDTIAMAVAQSKSS